jgi:hypothetical protein
MFLCTCTATTESIHPFSPLSLSPGNKSTKETHSSQIDPTRPYVREKDTTQTQSIHAAPSNMIHLIDKPFFPRESHRAKEKKPKPRRRDLGPSMNAMENKRHVLINSYLSLPAFCKSNLPSPRITKQPIH